MGTCASGGNVITFVELAGELEKASGGYGSLKWNGEGVMFVRKGVLGVYFSLSKAGDIICNGVKISDQDRLA